MEKYGVVRQEPSDVSREVIRSSQDEQFDLSQIRDEDLLDKTEEE
jgi:hypothetical protein